MKPYVLGLDPGLTGALALYDMNAKALHHVWDIPTIVSPTSGKRVIDVAALSQGIDVFASKISFAVLEDVSSRPGEGVASTFKFGEGFGTLKGILAANYIPTHLVKPAVWKILLGLNSSKTLSRERAMSLFPTHKQFFRRAKDDGRAEAALLAWFGADRLANLHKGD